MGITAIFNVIDLLRGQRLPTHLPQSFNQPLHSLQLMLLRPQFKWRDYLLGMCWKRDLHVCATGLY